MIEGHFVRLRAFERGDVDANHAFVNDRETLRGMLSGIPFPSSMEDEYRWLEQQTSYSRGEYQFAIEDAEGDLVGRCGVIRVDWKNRVGELAIMIGTPYRGRGYGKEAMLCHKSQVKHGWQVEDGGENDNSLFGLYFTCVGPDEAKNDFLEHIE